MKHFRGFSLIELMIGIAIMGILLSLAAPSYMAYIDNAKIRASAQTFLSGIQGARTEALRRNGTVEFILTNTDYSALLGTHATLGRFLNGAVVASAAGQNWLVRFPTTDPANGNANIDLFTEGKLGVDGAGGSSTVPSPVVIAGSVDTVAFNNFGRTTLAATATFNFTNPTGGACAPAGNMRCLRVVVSPGGQARLCDPAVNPVTSPGDTRLCP
jgi:type IV fimbrial biogenesis protein FimT